MNNYIHSECPICHTTLPAAQRPAHLAAHARRNVQAAVRRAEFLRKLSNKAIAKLLIRVIWANLDPLSWEASILEAAIGRLEGKR